MNLKKKILIVGSIADFGGREIEVKNIITAISKVHDVKLLSTVPMTEHSVAINGLNCQWTTIYKELYYSNFSLKAFSLFTKIWNRSKLPAYFLVSNKINNVLFNFRKKNKCILKKEIDLVDVVLFCGIFTSGFLEEIATYTLKSNKAFLLRTTGTITDIPEKIKELLPTFSLIMVHSNSNVNVLKDVTVDNVRIVDQTTLIEDGLLVLPIEKSDNITYGYIGRFSKEKGIIELLNIFKELDKKLVIAGNGPLINEVENLCKECSFLNYMGELSSNGIVDFFNKIDVLIIPSLEESGPLVGVEAMAAGKLIVSTKVGAMMDRLENCPNQFWFDISDKSSLLKRISEIENLDKDTMVANREALRVLFKSKYSQETIADDYLKSIEDSVL
jgi:glycosyltransferase involved in cell wall biosynthesis